MSLLSDLRFAVRSLSQARGFTLAVLVALALGIGANTAVFSLLQQRGRDGLTSKPFGSPGTRAVCPGRPPAGRRQAPWNGV